MKIKTESVNAAKRWAAIVPLLALTTGCFQERPATQPPIHIVPNMDQQEKYTVQSHSKFFPDGSAMRHPVEGTIGRGNLRADTAYYQGKNERGELIKKIPTTVDMALLERGRERFDIYCAVCHGQTGVGNGLITQRGLLPPPSFHEQRLRDKEDGYFFDIITHGKGNMSSYRHQVNVSDRWAIVAYLRALQKSQNASLADLPEAERAQFK